MKGVNPVNYVVMNMRIYEYCFSIRYFFALNFIYNHSFLFN